MRVDSTEKMAFKQQTEPIKRKFLPVTYNYRAYELVGDLSDFICMAKPYHQPSSYLGN